MNLSGGTGRTVAAVVLGGSSLFARRPAVSAVEERAFRVLNRSVGPAERPLWAVMQFGNGLAAGVAPIVLRSSGRSWPESVRIGMAAGGAWHLAKLVKASVHRERPAALLPQVVLRDGDPAGRGFVSGHAAVAMSLALAAGPVVSPGVQRTLIAAAFVVGIARVHVGAHLPLDVVGALALAAVWAPVCAPRSASTGVGPAAIGVAR